MRALTARLRSAVPLLGLVGLDAILKIAAFRLINPAQTIGASPNLQLVLRLNKSGMGSWAQASYANDVSLIRWRLGFSAIAIAVTLAFTSGRRKGRRFLVLSCLGASLGGAILAGLMSNTLCGLDDWTAIVFSRGAGTILWIVAWSLTQSPTWKMGFFLLAAASAGNFVSFLYPPFGVVDYLSSAPLSALTKMGVINLADAMFLVAIPVLALSALHSGWRRLARNRKRTIETVALDADK